MDDEHWIKFDEIQNYAFGLDIPCYECGEDLHISKTARICCKCHRPICMDCWSRDGEIHSLSDPRPCWNSPFEREDLP